MLSTALQTALTDQIQKEFYSAYLYLAMSGHFEAANLPGFAHWMRVQFQEEQAHGLKLLDYVHDRGGRVVLRGIEQPPAEWGTPLEVFVQVLEHEKKITASISRLYELALQEKDYATQVMLGWFVTEQVEEEKNVSQILETLKLVEARGTAILMLDHKLAKRDH